METRRRRAEPRSRKRAGRIKKSEAAPDAETSASAVVLDRNPKGAITACEHTNRPLYSKGLCKQCYMVSSLFYEAPLKLCVRSECNIFVPVLIGDGTKIAPTEDILDQTPGGMSWIQGKLTDHVGEHVVLSPEGVVLIAFPGDKIVVSPPSPIVEQLTPYT